MEKNQIEMFCKDIICNMGVIMDVPGIDKKSWKIALNTAIKAGFILNNSNPETFKDWSEYFWVYEDMENYSAQKNHDYLKKELI